MFEAARTERPAAANDLWPYWIYPLENGAQIERHVPMLPLSREVERYARLRRSVALYRMVFGQTRQEDLLQFLLTYLPPDEAERQAAELRLDLGPPRPLHAREDNTGVGQYFGIDASVASSAVTGSP
jgi:hypothetical protein